MIIYDGRIFIMTSEIDVHPASMFTPRNFCQRLVDKIYFSISFNYVLFRSREIRLSRMSFFVRISVVLTLVPGADCSDVHT